MAAHSQIERGDYMHGDYFDDFMPGSIDSENLNLRDRRDMVNLGKENLMFLATFWKKHAEKMRAKIKVEPDYRRREKFEQDADESAFKAREIRKIAEGAESKPRLFEKPTFKTGARVTCFMEKPDRYVSGILAKVKADTEEEDEEVVLSNAVLAIRVYDQSGRQQLIDFVPEGFTMFLTEDYEYFKTHLAYFRMYLGYFAQSVPDQDKANRMLFCISGQSNPIDVA